MPQSIVYDLIVLGAGASGLMCACTAAQRGLRVLLLEQAARPGRKIAISGGGKCNFTNRSVHVQAYVGAQPAFCEPALRAFPPEEMLDWFKAHRLGWEERDHGRLFGRQPAEQIVDALLRDAFAAGVELHTGLRVERIERDGQSGQLKKSSQSGQPGDFSQLDRLEQFGQLDQFGQRVEPEGPESAGPGTPPLFTVYCGPDQSCWQGRQVVLALGSPACPQCGGSHTGLHCAKALGHSVIPLRPALTPFRMAADWPLRGLAGISLEVEITLADRIFADALLFTHQGISGPAALQASCHWSPGTALCVNFLPEKSFTSLLDARECGKLLVKNLLGRHLPQRLVEGLLSPLPENLAQRKVAELSRAHRNLLAQSVHAHSAVPAGIGDLRKAEAAAGGVAVHEVNSHSLESLVVPGLFLCGEVLDVTGHLGGYNLHWAWASGRLAGERVGKA